MSGHDRFNPSSLSSWIGLSNRVWNLYQIYLDHCPAFDEESDLAALVAKALTSTVGLPGAATDESIDAEEERQGDQSQQQISMSIAPFLIPYFGGIIQWPKLRPAVQTLAQGT